MIIAGKALAAEIKQELKKKMQNKNLRLVVVWVGEDPASAKYVERKKKIGEEIGVEVLVHEFSEEITQEELEEAIRRLGNDENVNGVIVQLPLPSALDTQKILSLIPTDKDVDALGEEAKVYSPVVEAVKEILKRSGVKIDGKKVVVIGKGKLVGLPVSLWLVQERGEVAVIDENTEEEAKAKALKEADIIVSGAGVPGLIKPDLIKEGVVLIDAGTSEAGGKLVGDADPACAAKCSIFTPVPGGVGPLTVVMLFKNLLELNQ